MFSEWSDRRDGAAWALTPALRRGDCNKAICGPNGPFFMDLISNPRRLCDHSNSLIRGRWFAFSHVQGVIWHRWRGSVHLPAPNDSAWAECCIHFLRWIIWHKSKWHRPSCALINAVRLRPAANNCPLLPFQCGFAQCSFHHLCIYLPSFRSRGGRKPVHIRAVTHGATWAVLLEIMTGADGGAACHLEQQLINEEEERGLFLLTRTKASWRPAAAQRSSPLF